jgi:para-nitrobenzyl esterase
MEKNMNFLIIVFCILYLTVLELSHNTVLGWVLAIALFVGFFLLRKNVLVDKTWWIRLLSWIGLFVLCFVIYKVSFPPYKQIPAVTVKNPKATEVMHIAQGDLTGVYNADESVEVYTGIPFAKPPVGDLRFKEPVPAGPWEGILTCDHFAPMSMQAENHPMWNSLVGGIFYNNWNLFNLHDNYREAMSEDSLYLNVWKPAGDVKDCPVIVYIHGGSLQTGQPSYDQYRGEEYAKRGIVFVSMGYRLNIFGYYADEALASESEHHTTGNYGTLDQIEALKWVNKNIADFGGDASNITLAGESAGASSVNALCVSPLAKGLFRRAVAESSGIVARTPYHTFRSYSDALAMKKDAWQTLGVSSAKEMRSLDAKDLVKAAGQYNSMTVDGYVIKEQPYLTYEKGENNEEALLNGFNAHEADVFTILGTKVTPDNYVDVLRGSFGEEATAIAKMYPVKGKDAKTSYNQVMSGAWFAYSHHVWSRYMASQNKPVYEYCFTKENKGLSTNHAGELPYFYGCLDTQPQNYTRSDYELSETIVSYITNFAKTGNPNGAGLPEWPTYSERPNSVLELGETIEMMKDPYLDLYQCLDKAQGSDGPE